MPPSLVPRQCRYGNLDCIVVDGGQSPRIAVVLCHGYGAPGHDLAGLSAEWIDLLGDHATDFRFVFPAAPGTLADQGMPSARAWWPINMEKLSEAAQTSQFEQVHELEPPGLDEARAALSNAVSEVTGEMQGRATPLVLGGFSQGAMLAMDTALRGLAEPPEVVLQFSGTLICRPAWQPIAHRLASTAVFQSHGTLDPILPFSSAEALRDLLVAEGVSVDFHSFIGPHTIDIDAISRSAQTLKRFADAES